VNDFFSSRLWALPEAPPPPVMTHSICMMGFRVYRPHKQSIRLDGGSSMAGTTSPRVIECPDRDEKNLDVVYDFDFVD